MLRGAPLRKSSLAVNAMVFKKHFALLYFFHKILNVLVLHAFLQFIPEGFYIVMNRAWEFVRAVLQPKHAEAEHLLAINYPHYVHQWHRLAFGVKIKPAVRAFIGRYDTFPDQLLQDFTNKRIRGVNFPGDFFEARFQPFSAFDGNVHDRSYGIFAGF